MDISVREEKQSRKHQGFWSEHQKEGAVINCHGEGCGRAKPHLLTPGKGLNRAEKEKIMGLLSQVLDVRLETRLVEEQGIGGARGDEEEVVCMNLGTPLSKKFHWSDR